MLSHFRTLALVLRQRRSVALQLNNVELTLCLKIQFFKCMKTITVNVSEPVYNDFREYAKQTDRKTSELIREAMERYRNNQLIGKTRIGCLAPLDGGKVLTPLTKNDDLLGEMLND